ncbi:MAG TPA: hypothetical protein VMF08_12520 [Candidatus Sulfotelmatobacter sp.]|nr:hypothetical protein [Candidatus Sulfotelmatobacter sp.]
MENPRSVARFIPFMLIAMCDTNQQSFALFSDNREIGSYDFPVYRDHWGNVEKVALTPLAVTADATVAGGIVAVFLAYCGWLPNPFLLTRELRCCTRRYTAQRAVFYHIRRSRENYRVGAAPGR